MKLNCLLHEAKKWMLFFQIMNYCLSLLIKKPFFFLVFNIHVYIYTYVCVCAAFVFAPICVCVPVYVYFVSLCVYARLSI